ncbi:MAG TPA: DUF2905 domain-containing protein [Terriglobales bacterium]|nr:DUF2905 domain-containing protein [Terriglobales bacterium]
MLPLLARWLIAAGVILAAAGLVLLLVARLHLPLGRLPGDVIYRGKHTTIYFPWVTMLLLSILATLLLNLLFRR